MSCRPKVDWAPMPMVQRVVNCRHEWQWGFPLCCIINTGFSSRTRRHCRQPNLLNCSAPNLPVCGMGGESVVSARGNSWPGSWSYRRTSWSHVAAASQSSRSPATKPHHFITSSVHQFIRSSLHQFITRDSRKSRKHGNHGNLDFRQMPWFWQTTVFAVFLAKMPRSSRFFCNKTFFLISVIWSLLCDFNTKMF